MSIKKRILKTIIDVLIGGLISLGVFQSPTFVIENGFSYIPLILLIVVIVILMRVYSKEKGMEFQTIDLLISVVVSMIEIFIIGVSIGYEVDVIIIVWFIILPTVIVFDKLMG